MSAGSPFLRWALAFPAAIAIAAVVQVAIAGSLALALGSTFGYRDWTIWLAKCVASFFIGGSFVTVAWLVAPNRKHVAAAAALGIVLVWGMTLIVGSLVPRVHVWVVAMGILGLIGGLVAFGLGHHAFTPKTAV